MSGIKKVHWNVIKMKLDYFEVKWDAKKSGGSTGYKKSVRRGKCNVNGQCTT